MSFLNDAGQGAAGKSVDIDNDFAFYATKDKNWYQALPYGFQITMANNKQYVAFLPISPSNLTITTHFPTNVVPTFYGTVEEHSDVRYFDISIDGTTGMVSKFSGTADGSDVSKAVSDATKSIYTRQSFEISSSISFGGFFSKTLGALNQIKNQAAQLNNGSNKPNTTGVTLNKTGYYAFHALYKMLLRHKRDASSLDAKGERKLVGSRTSHPIVFFNYKDNNKYNVIIRAFTMRRSADNPMLYYYNIQMRGYALKDLESEDIDEDKDARLKELGLNGISGSSVLGEIKKRANSVKGILGAASGGINVLGR